MKYEFYIDKDSNQKNLFCYLFHVILEHFGDFDFFITSETQYRASAKKYTYAEDEYEVFSTRDIDDLNEFYDSISYEHDLTIIAFDSFNTYKYCDQHDVSIIDKGFYISMTIFDSDCEEVSIKTKGDLSDQIYIFNSCATGSIVFVDSHEEYSDLERKKITDFFCSKNIIHVDD